MPAADVPIQEGSMRNLSVMAALAVCMLLVGCKRTHEDVAKDMISCMKDLTAALKDVKDEASAKAAVPKITAIRDRMLKIDEETKKMGEPPAAEKEQLTKKYESQMDEVGKAFFAEMTRVASDPKLAPAMKALEDATKAMGNKK
jgi:hypothetical protein